jgi:hypothetical protein
MEKLKGISRRYIFVAAASALGLIGAVSPSTARAQGTDLGSPRWVATWSVPPMAHGSAIGASRSFENQTVRQIVYISAGGTRVRVKLSNGRACGNSQPPSTRPGVRSDPADPGTCGSGYRCDARSVGQNLTPAQQRQTSGPEVEWRVLGTQKVDF